MKKLLFDASSLLKALKDGRLELVEGGFLQWLTVYEALNALWKEAVLAKAISLEDACRLAEVVSELLGLVEVLDVRMLEREVVELAAKLGLTAYDASYVALARKLGLTLVTEDRRLRSSASRMVGVVDLASLS